MASPLIHLIAVMVVRGRRLLKPMPTPIRDGRTGNAPQGAGLKDYLREAFFFRWNMLFFLGGLAGAALAPMSGVLLPLVAAGELTFLAGLVTIPRFRAAIDAKVHSAQKRAGTAAASPPPTQSLVAMLAGLPTDARRRFELLHARCVEMRAIAVGVRGTAGDATGTAEEIRTPGLDRLLWLFLRLLLSKTALDRFLATMNNEEITARLEQLRKDLAAAQSAGDDPSTLRQAQGRPEPGRGTTGSVPSRAQSRDDRIVRSLQDSIAMAELRLDNSERARKNAQFVSIELDRIEGKIRALAEMAVNRQDPDFLSTQVDSAAESMRQTEKAVSELQHLTGLADELQEPPPILESDLREVLKHDA